jgi:hypothetical protein
VRWLVVLLLVLSSIAHLSIDKPLSNHGISATRFNSENYKPFPHLFKQLNWRGYMNNVIMKTYSKSIASAQQSWRRFCMPVIAVFKQKGWLPKSTISFNRVFALARTQICHITHSLSHCFGCAFSRFSQNYRLRLLNIFAIQASK